VAGAALRRARRACVGAGQGEARRWGGWASRGDARRWSRVGEAELGGGAAREQVAQVAASWSGAAGVRR
jgi:hypothetical protein